MVISALNLVFWIVFNIAWDKPTKKSPSITNSPWQSSKKNKFFKLLLIKAKAEVDSDVIKQ